VIASVIQTSFATPLQIPQFVSLTSSHDHRRAITGFIGDKMGRRFTYQINLLISGWRRSPPLRAGI